MNPKTTTALRAIATLLIAALTLAACSVSFTTAHISDLKLFNDKAKQHAVATFKPHDSVYAQAVVANAVQKVSLKFQLITADVQGQAKDGVQSALDTTVELPGDGNGTYTLTPPDNGWPVGKYRVEVGMFIEGGARKDFKTINFDVSED